MKALPLAETFPLHQELLDSHTPKSWGGSRGLRDRERIRWSTRKRKKTFEPNAKIYVRGFWIAELHSWVAGQDTDRTARRMPNGPAKTDALFFVSFCPSLPLFFSPCLSLCLCLFLSSHSIPALYITSCCCASFMLTSSWILFPLPLSNSWHNILPAE